MVSTQPSRIVRRPRLLAAMAALGVVSTLVGITSSAPTAVAPVAAVWAVAPSTTASPIDTRNTDDVASRSHHRNPCADGDCLPPSPKPSASATKATLPPAPAPAKPASAWHPCNKMSNSVFRVQGPCPAKPSKAEVQSIEHQILAQWGWADQFSCLDKIVELEDNWNVYDENSIHAYGLPQALPGNKMASAGADWGWNPWTQLKWMFGYIKGRYGNPCHALSVRQSRRPTWY